MTQNTFYVLMKRNYKKKLKNNGKSLIQINLQAWRIINKQAT